MAGDPRAETAEQFERAAEELDAAAAHLRTAARHFRDHDVPRGCAHAFAAHGHMRVAQTSVDERAVEHAAHSNPQ